MCARAQDRRSAQRYRRVGPCEDDDDDDDLEVLASASQQPPPSQPRVSVVTVKKVTPSRKVLSAPRQQARSSPARLGPRRPLELQLCQIAGRAVAAVALLGAVAALLLSDAPGYLVAVVTSLVVAPPSPPWPPSWPPPAPPPLPPAAPAPSSPSPPPPVPPPPPAPPPRPRLSPPPHPPPPPRPPPPPPPPRPHPKPPPPPPVDTSNVLNRLNRRFAGGHPTSDTTQAGVLVHSFDGREDRESPWLECTGVRLYCMALARGNLDRIAASVGVRVRRGLARPTLHWRRPGMLCCHARKLALAHAASAHTWLCCQRPHSRPELNRPRVCVCCVGSLCGRRQG